MCGKVCIFGILKASITIMSKSKSYTVYRNSVVEQLVSAVGKTWNDGLWFQTGTSLPHILPTKHTDDTRKNRENRAEAIKEYLGFDCRKCLGDKLIGLHPYAHHLSSSQLLCMMFFSNLMIDEHRVNKHRVNIGMISFAKEVLGINISSAAQCYFEYTEKRKPYIFEVEGKDEYEGTSFDFYIKDGDIEIYFEIKFTENGFSKAAMDSRHDEKITQYRKLLPSYLNKKPTDGEFRKYYQLFRNIIRSGKNKYVVFLTDENNPSTEKEKTDFQELFGTSAYIKFITWQDIKNSADGFYPCKLPYQFNAM